MTLQELHASSVQRVLIKNGYLAPKIIYHIEIFFYWESFIIQGENRYNAVTWTAEKFSCHEGSVYRIVKKISELKKSLENENSS